MASVWLGVGIGIGVALAVLLLALALRAWWQTFEEGLEYRLAQRVAGIVRDVLQTRKATAAETPEVRAALDGTEEVLFNYRRLLDAHKQLEQEIRYHRDMTARALEKE